MIHSSRSLKFLRILTGKRILKWNYNPFEKYEYGHLVVWYMKSTLYPRILIWNKVFKKIKQLLVKLHSLWYVRFVLTILFVLTLASDRAVLCGNVAFSILVLSTKKGYFSFLRRVCVFQKICLNVKYWKRLKFPVIFTKKHANLSKGALL